MNRKGISLLWVAVMMSMAALTYAQPDGKVEKQTFTFAVKGSDTLKLDKYEVPTLTVVRPKPVLLFAFGGGFKGGDRARKGYIPYFHFLANNGYVVVSTDYRVGLKNLAPGSIKGPEDFVGALQRAIGMAVEDFFDATRFILDKSEEWKVNPQCIVACGSSAGAVTSLQAEYEICTGSELAQRLPESFNYAGVVAFAGAIAGDGNPVWTRKPCPVMLFHGDADRTVPFRKAVLNNIGLWGSASIAEALEEMQLPYYFYKVENAGHEIADVPMRNNKYDVLSFLSKLVVGQEKLMINTDVKKIGQAEVRKDFTLQDYIQNNM